MVGIRPARPEDAQAIVDVRIAAWRAAYDGLMPADFLAAMDDDREQAARGLADRLAGHADRSLVVGLDAEHAVAGMCSFGPARDETGDGELYAINVHPRAWGRGLGTALLHAAERGLAG